MSNFITIIKKSQESEGSIGNSDTEGRFSAIAGDAHIRKIRVKV
ncbi:MAG: hypothetical protein ACTSRG_20765 [Candidatus Helarchaeota archaeon]